ncbi:ABC transporter permease [Rossellomorea yichunensis]|uniref:ABC transporter permease n=1 Tax=Rossellomorea yichunensis TaxID=3077331 RepID=UPI0028DE48CF|nr:FtsX-like permease family protein [Rossellomorea sp. YC4-1]MDT9027519.1 FtsX-like permease family protein [Rossellomorea sp. YC4-1]
MFTMIWRGWWRHKERFILMLIGVLVISGGLSYMAISTDTSKGTINDILQKNWNSQYHILVRPTKSKSNTESENLISPNYLSSLKGGISLDQYKTIKSIDDISIAAPISMIGYTTFAANLKAFNETEFSENKIYRLTYNKNIKNGLEQPQMNESTSYITKNPDLLSKDLNFLNRNIVNTEGYLLLAGIDPEQEAKLTGLDASLLTKGKNRYFEEQDIPGVRVREADTELKIPKQQHTSIPVLLSSQYYAKYSESWSIEELELNKKLDSIKPLLKTKGLTYLDQFDGKEISTFSIYSNDLYQLLIKQLTQQSINPKFIVNGKPPTVEFTRALRFSPNGLNYEHLNNPFPDRWEYSYDIQPINNADGPHYDIPDGYRKLEPINDWSDSSFYDLKHYIDPEFIGVYDPSRLNVAKNPLTELPMETYRPPTAELVVDETDKPVNPPRMISPSGSPAGFLQEPPSLLTTIDAAEEILGNKPISAIRIKVKGVSTFNEESQEILKSVISQIEKKTGLEADITLGSSPQPTLLHVPQSGNQQEIGWIEMPWIKLGTSTTIFKETKLGFSGIILVVLIVAIIYVLATNLVSFLARRREFAVLLALGWKISTIYRLIILEALLIGGIVATISLTVSGYFISQNGNISLNKVIILALSGLIIYLLGSIAPLLMVRKVTPYETIKIGEYQQIKYKLLKSPTIWSMAVNHMFGKLGRNSLSILAMVFPTTLLAVFIFITFRLKGVLYTTWLGQYTAMEVGSAHYIAMGTALLISILTTAELMWQNVVERKSEISILKSLGWRNNAVRKIILFEAIFAGMIAGIFSIILSFLFIFVIYGEPINTQYWLTSLTGLIPLIVSVIGAILPAQIAVRITPSEGMRQKSS